jgi:hypothetical protein
MHPFSPRYKGLILIVHLIMHSQGQLCYREPGATLVGATYGLRVQFTPIAHTISIYYFIKEFT